VYIQGFIQGPIGGNIFPKLRKFPKGFQDCFDFNVAGGMNTALLLDFLVNPIYNRSS